MAITTVEGIEGLRELVGADLGTTSPVLVDQARIDAFADTTLDRQWIHVDVERANAGPFGGPIAHGYLTLSLAAHFAAELLEVKGISMAVNYGLEKVRFPSSVPAGAELSASGTLVSVEDVAGGVQCLMKITMAVAGAAKPSCVAEVLFRYYA